MKETVWLSSSSSSSTPSTSSSPPPPPPRLTPKVAGDLTGAPEVRRRSKSFSISTSSGNSSTIPFSWESMPGIPKTPASVLGNGSPSPDTPLLLPLPPPIRCTAMRRRSTPRTCASHPSTADPFSAAMAECAKDDPAPSTPRELEEFWRRRSVYASRCRSISDRIGLIDCRTSCSVSHSMVRVPRGGATAGRSDTAAVAYTVLNRRRS